MRPAILMFCALAAATAIASPQCHSLAQAPAATRSVATAASAPTGASPSATYPDEPVVIEHLDDVTSYAADGTGLKESTCVALLQSDSAIKQFGVVTIPYASKSEHVEILYARVRHPDGTVVETETADALDMPTPVMQRAPFYSDLKEIQLPIRSLRVGDTLEWKVRVTRTKAEAPGQFWGHEVFNGKVVILSQTFELRFPDSVAVNVWSPVVKPVESVVDRQHIYRWRFTQLQPTAGKVAEAATAARKKVLWTADQEVDAEQGLLPAIAWTTFDSWQAVGAWYQSLEADRIVPDSTVKAKAAELTAGKSTDEDKARALYNYVATNIRYIGVAFGVGRYQPHTAAEILTNQYGDCKDKHTLLAAMLSSVGIQSDAVLIGAGIRFNEAVPSPASFNHLITHLTLGGQAVWLDSTAEVAPWRMLVSVTRDRQALVIPPGIAAPSIVRTPANPPFPDMTDMNAVGSLDSSGVSTSHIVLSFRGDGEIPARAAFRLLPPAQYDQAVQVFSKAIGFPGTTSNPDVSRPTETSQAFKLTYDYKREKAGDWEHLKTVPELAPVALPRVTDMEPPVHAIQLGIPRVEISHAEMKLPDGWSAILPKAVHAKCAYGTYDLTYRFDNGILYADRNLEVLVKKVPVSDWQAYKIWVDQIHPGQEPYVQLVNAQRPIVKGPGSVAGLGALQSLEQRTKQIEDALKSSDPVVKNSVAYALATSNDHLSDAQTLAEQAVELQEKTASKVVSMDDKVKSFDQMGILGADWETLGWVYFRQGQHEKAETYMHAAWELKPRNADINMYMGIIYDALHKPADATTFYRMALSASNLPALQSAIHARFDRLGVTTTDPLPMDVTTSLPSLNFQLNAGDTEPLVDILLTRDKPPVVNLLQGNLALEKPLAQAIQSALANPFPDTGPEKLLRRARVTCSAGACALHFLGSQVAMEASSYANLGKVGH